MHPLAGAWEASFGGLLPSSDLLEWIEDEFENVKTPADRSLGKWSNIALTKDLFQPNIQQ